MQHPAPPSPAEPLPRIVLSCGSVQLQPQLFNMLLITRFERSGNMGLDGLHLIGRREHISMSHKAYG